MNEEAETIEAPAETTEAPEGLAGAAAEEAPKAKFVGAEEEDDDHAEGKGNAVPQWRVNEIARERREAREEAAALRARVQELEARTPRQAPEASEPDPKDYASLQEFLAARDAHRESKILEKASEQLTQREAAREQQAQIQRIASDFAGKFETAKAENPDVIAARDHVDNLINTGRLQIHPAIAREIMTHEDAPHLVYEIATNPALMKTLRSGDMSASLKAIYRFQHQGVGKAPAAGDESLTMPTATPAAPKRPSAPERVPSGGGGGGSPSNFSDYKAWREKQ